MIAFENTYHSPIEEGDDAALMFEGELRILELYEGATEDGSAASQGLLIEVLAELQQVLRLVFVNRCFSQGTIAQRKQYSRSLLDPLQVLSQELCGTPEDTAQKHI